MAAPFWIENLSAYARDVADPLVGVLAASARARSLLHRGARERDFTSRRSISSRWTTHAEAWTALAGRALEPNVFFEPGFALALAQHRSGALPRFVAVWREKVGRGSSACSRSPRRLRPRPTLA